jgi:hypothetical protein
MNYKLKLLLLITLFNCAITIQAMNNRRPRVFAFDELNPNPFQNPLVEDPNFGIIPEDQAQGTAFNPDQNIQNNGPAPLFNNEDKK